MRFVFGQTLDGDSWRRASFLEGESQGVETDLTESVVPVENRE